MTVAIIEITHITIPTIDVIIPAVAVPGLLPVDNGFCITLQMIPAILNMMLPQQQHPVMILMIPRINEMVAIVVESVDVVLLDV